MRQFGIEAEDPVFTGLFNACANSPWPQDGLKRATNLLEAMKDHGHPPNAITYNAALKCFGKFGELQVVLTLALFDNLMISDSRIDSMLSFAALYFEANNNNLYLIYTC